jgi:hypothetical protein
MWQRQCASSCHRQVLARNSTLFSTFHIDELRGIYTERNDSNTIWARNRKCCIYSDEGRNTKMAITLTKLLLLSNPHIAKFPVTYKVFPYVKWRRLTWHNIVESECIGNSLWAHYHKVHWCLGAVYYYLDIALSSMLVNCLRAIYRDINVLSLLMLWACVSKVLCVISFFLK